MISPEGEVEVSDAVRTVRRQITKPGSSSETSSSPSAHLERPSARAGEVERVSLADIEPDFEVRDGDILVVSYPEVTLPLPAKFSGVKVGGWIYTRKLRDGDNATEQASKIYAWLSRVAERTGAEKVKLWATEFGG